jgi:mannose-6-phosphate isomerase-like protein (cupin superfamily)
MSTEEGVVNSDGTITLGPGEGRTVSIGPNQITFKLDGEQTGGAFSVIEYSVAPKFQAPPALHFHTKDSWAAYILEGALAFQFGERVVSAQAGSFLLLPKKVPFKWWNPEDAAARWLVIYFPAGFEKYFEAVNEITKELPPGPIDSEKLMPKLLPLWQKYGIGMVDSEG